MNDAQKLKAITDQVAIAAQAVNDSSHAASVGIDPTKVWQAAATVIDSATERLDSMLHEQYDREIRSGRVEIRDAVRWFVTSRGAKS